MADGFFAVSSDVWPRACQLGMNPAIALLVLARGTGKDHRTTHWSAEAISTRTSITWRRAADAIKALEGPGLITRQKAGSRPRYRLDLGGHRNQKDVPLIWLPNTLVDGPSGGAAPIERVRQTGDLLTLRLLVDLYQHHAILDDLGVTRGAIYEPYTRHRVGAYAEFEVWGFAPKGHQTVVPNHPIAHPFNITKHVDGDMVKTKFDNERFWQSVRGLGTLGLIEWVPVLWEHEGLDAEPIHALHWQSRIEAERRLHATALEAAQAMVTPGQMQWAVDQGSTFAVPVLRHLTKVALIGIVRLTHRPHTRITAAAFAEWSTKGAEYAERYRAIVERINPTAKTG